MLETYIGRKKNVVMRISRMMKACFLVRKRIKGAKLTKRTQARIVEACEESTGLFDTQI